jgi:hypothetical protein
MSLIEPAVELCALVGEQLACPAQDQLAGKCGRGLALAEQRACSTQRLFELGVTRKRYSRVDGRHNL